jgi:hypothetical protein
MPANTIAGLKTRFTVWMKICRTLNLLGSAASMSLPRCFANRRCSGCYVALSFKAS